MPTHEILLQDKVAINKEEKERKLKNINSMNFKKSYFGKK